MTIRLRPYHALVALLVLALLAVAFELHVRQVAASLRADVRTEVARSLEPSGSIAAVTAAEVDARLMDYCEIMNDGMGVETTSPAATFWWAGQRIAANDARQERVFDSLEQVFDADRDLGRRFLRVHKAIDNKPYSWPYKPEDLQQPYLTYTE